MPSRLREAKVEVTHAALDGNALVDRHIVRATDQQTGSPWALECFAAYEFTAGGKIIRQLELTRVLDGKLRRLVILVVRPIVRDQTGIAVVYFTRFSAKCDADVAIAGCASSSCMRNCS